MTATQQLRYHLPKKAIKGDCPQCSPRHRKTFSRFVDQQTGEPLPDIYGRCDRESNCGYYLSPYDKGASGVSYADQHRQAAMPKEWFQLAGTYKRQHLTRQAALLDLIQQGATTEQAEQVAAYIFERVEPTPSLPDPIHVIPGHILQKSLTGYENNALARFLASSFGDEVTNQLLQRFQIGTSTHWEGANVFWLIDYQGRVRGGQICVYDETGHKVKRRYTNPQGQEKTQVLISSVRAALHRKYREVTPPDWLVNFPDDAQTWPVVFGLPQLQYAPPDAPVALVEGCKSAVICSHLLRESGFIWLAVGGKSYLKAERLEGLKGRKIMAYPDVGAYEDWSKRAEPLRAAGFDITVSDLLEQMASEQDRLLGLDLADYLLRMAEPTTDQEAPVESMLSDQPVEPTRAVVKKPPDTRLDFPVAPLAYAVDESYHWTRWCDDEPEEEEENDQPEEVTQVIV